jgi:anthranilate phosphoribosyltransferase
MMKPQEALAHIIDHREIAHDEMLSLMRQVMRGELSPTLIAAIMTGLRMKGEPIDEIAAAAQVMREFATRVEVSDREPADTCGTGGDPARLIFHHSGFVAASAGAPGRKHGGRSVSANQEVLTC